MAFGPVLLAVALCSLSGDKWLRWQKATFDRWFPCFCVLFFVVFACFGFVFFLFCFCFRSLLGGGLFRF